jgi:hypothetical protein
MANKKDDDLTFEERQLALEERRLANEERTLALQEAALKVQQAQLKQTAPKSNAMGPGISVYNRRGEKDFPMPRLKCEVYCPWQITPELQESSPQLTREEVELFNLIEPGDYTIEMNDGTSQALCVVGVINQNDGRLEKLSLMGAKDPDTGHYTGLFKQENKNLFPSMTGMLRQILAQRGVLVDVRTMKQEAQLIKDGLPVSVGA